MANEQDPPEHRAEQHNETRLQSAHVVHSGSGHNIFMGGSFAPVPTAPSNKCNLPNRHPHFIGREEQIQEIVTALASRAWIVTIDGMGGIGKTTLALEAAYRCKEHSGTRTSIPRFTGYIWTSARDKPNFCLDNVTEAILAVLSPSELFNGSPGQDRTLLAARALSQEPCLLIVDNLESVNDESLMLFLRDLPGSSKALITSRHHLQTGERVINLLGLDEDDAVKLLRLEAERLHIPISDQDIALLRIIAKLAHGIPFVLRWVMDRVYDGMKLGQILTSLEDAKAKDVFDYIFKLSLSRLDPQTRIVFRSMSLLPTWSPVGAISAMNPSISALPERIGELVKYCLVEDNRKLAESNRRYRLHPFTQYLAKKEFADAPDGQMFIENALKYYREYLTLTLKNNQADDFEADLHNINNLIQVAFLQESNSILLLCGQIVELLHQLGKSQMLADNVVEIIKERIRRQQKLKDDSESDRQFLCLERNDLRAVPVLSQVFDHHWFPRSMLRELMSGTLTHHPARDIGELIRAEYLRALINGDQLVVRLVDLYNNPVFSQDYLPGSKNREAFKKLLDEGVIVPFLLKERAPNEVVESCIPESLNAWQQLCEEVRMQCVRLSWDQQQNEEYVNDFIVGRFTSFALSLVAKNVDMLVRYLGLDPSVKDEFRKQLHRVARTALDLQEMKGTVTREDLYKAFVILAGTQPAERLYDGTKPFAGEIKQLLDLAYQRNFADALDGYLLTPIDSLPRTALQETADELTGRLSNITVQDFMGMLQRPVFSSVHEGLYLPSLHLLDLTDVCQVRRMNEWYDYQVRLRALLADPIASFAAGGAQAVQEAYVRLAEQMTKLVGDRYAQDMAKFAVRTVFVNELVIEIGAGLISVVGMPDGPIVQFAGANALATANKKALPFAVRFVVRDIASKHANKGLSTSMELMRGKVREGAQQWEELLRYIKEIRAFEEGEILSDQAPELTPPEPVD
jgi:hypothetical protein